MHHEGGQKGGHEEGPPTRRVCCNLCNAENFAATRFLHEVAAPGMSDRELTMAVWERMHGPDGPWAWKRRRKPR